MHDTMFILIQLFLLNKKMFLSPLRFVYISACDKNRISCKLWVNDRAKGISFLVFSFFMSIQDFKPVVSSEHKGVKIHLKNCCWISSELPISRPYKSSNRYGFRSPVNECTRDLAVGTATGLTIPLSSAVFAKATTSRKVIV